MTSLYVPQPRPPLAPRLRGSSGVGAGQPPPPEPLSTLRAKSKSQPLHRGGHRLPLGYGAAPAAVQASPCLQSRYPPFVLSDKSLSTLPAKSKAMSGRPAGKGWATCQATAPPIHGWLSHPPSVLSQSPITTCCRPGYLQSFVFLSAPANNTPLTLGQVPETLPQHSASNSLRLPAWRCFLPGPQSTWPQNFQSTISICNIYIYTQYSTGPPPRQRTNSPGRATRHTLPRRTNARRRGSAGGGPGDTSTGLVLSFSRSPTTPREFVRPVSNADKSLGCKGLVSADRSEAAALLGTTPRSIPKSSASDFAPLSTAEWYPRSRARGSYSPGPECAGCGPVPSWR